MNLREQTNPLRKFFAPLFLPALLFAIGEGSLVPIIPLTALHLGSGLAGAGLISGLLMIGIIAGDVPAGWVVVKWGERTAMIVAAAIGAAGSVTCFFSTALPTLAIGVFIIGVASAVFGLARQSFLTVWAPLEFRARAMSLLGGAFRVGMFVGPFLAAPVIVWAGTSAVYWIAVAMCVTVAICLLVVPDPEAMSDHAEDSGAAVAARRSGGSTGAKNGVGKVFRQSLFTLVRLGTAAAILQTLRASRQVILPLWGVHLGIDDAQLAVIMGVAGAMDVALFYTSGQIMDRFGRVWAAVPVMLGLAVGHIALVFTGSPGPFLAVAIFISAANGTGSGIIMTLGSDLAPADNPTPYLSVWRLISDSGNALGPLLISGLTSIASLAVASTSIGALGFVGVFLMARYIPKLIPKRTKQITPSPSET